MHARYSLMDEIIRFNFNFFFHSFLAFQPQISKSICVHGTRTSKSDC